ncbi:hypothetical protein NEOLI_002689 [Neolecta irregularis DAH-3]|uniref:Uncharacterized protein n=1 Tax=Neolecta irregularis (strain DAH-3) TaxID=1198029 RepID=A0A1U7LX66_NEOID|nr:hypothetical protein NEOLI_002689 [Neolecta irregularis DAH-3]|eukprot:OLL27173.1 hypothetical protein NEOLI_002689 [Neolecta irregularis DAH-3]
MNTVPSGRFEFPRNGLFAMGGSASTTYEGTALTRVGRSRRLPEVVVVDITGGVDVVDVDVVDVVDVVGVDVVDVDVVDVVGVDVVGVDVVDVVDDGDGIDFVDFPDVGEE